MCDKNLNNCMDNPLIIILAGCATLFVELTFIRYLPGEIRILGYFTNFVLFAAFFGFGLGIIVAHRWPKLIKISWLAPVSMVIILALSHIGKYFNILPSTEEFLFLQYQSNQTEIPLYPFLFLTYVLLTISFIPLGNIVGRTLSGEKPLWRYGLNVLGSIVGIILFVILSKIGARPWVWILCAGIISFIGLIQASSIIWILQFVGVIGIVFWTAHATKDVIWSPYQTVSTVPIYFEPGQGIISEWKLPTLSPQRRDKLVKLNLKEGFVVRVNDDSYQSPVNLNKEAIQRHPELKKMALQYDVLYTLRDSPGDVLVLGAGTGNDIAAALRAGATSVDAVEIDPEILHLGQKHPEFPYKNPRVHKYVEDGRRFLIHTKKRYDMIIYGLLDSQVLLSYKSNVRLDSFIFTREGFTLAKRRLKPDGMLLVSHAVGHDWFIDRMRGTLTAAFGKPPLILSEYLNHPLGFIYVSGNSVPSGRPVSDNITINEDDWPFLYLHEKTIPATYLWTILLIVSISLIGLRLISGSDWKGIDLHFFSLGGGFMLLETRGIAVLSILIGSTWGVNASIFTGVLCMSLIATIIGAYILRARDNWFPWPFYLLLFLTLLLNFFIPISSFLGLNPIFSAVLGIGLVSLPIFASGIIFANSLKQSGQADKSVASNLLGAICGGLTEYIAMISGFRYLLIIALLFYLLALLFNIKTYKLRKIAVLK